MKVHSISRVCKLSLKYPQIFSLLKKEKSIHALQTTHRRSEMVFCSADMSTKEDRDGESV